MPALLVPVLAAIAPALHADLVDGTVLAHDRVANVIVLNDKTIWSLDTLETPIPDDLVAGDRIEISYESNEDDGVRVIHAIKRLP